MPELNPDLLGRIRITSTPYGEAPEEIRQKWVGIEMPCLFYDQHAESKGLFSTEYKGAEPAFLVMQKDAIDALAEVYPEAARWWNSKGYPKHAEATWLFDAKAVTVLKQPVSRSELMGENN